MREEASLERSYRRLLRAYPRYYRHERGTEILTTLLDASRPGQLRATRGEAVHLLLAGLRFRLAPPGWAGKVVAGVATVWMAVVLSGVGAYVAWALQSTNGPDLDRPELTALSDALAGQGASWVDLPGNDPLDMAYTYPSRGEFQWFAVEGWDGARPVPLGHTRGYEGVSGAPTKLADAHQRLRDEGWQTGVTTGPEPCACSLFWAYRDGILLRMSSAVDTGPQATVVVGLYRTEPGGVPASAVAGFLTGLVVAWPVMAWLAQRFVRASRRSQVLIVLFGLPALVACVASTVDNVLSMVPDPDTDSVLFAADFMYPLANQVANPLAAGVTALGLTVAAVLAPRTGQGGPGFRLAARRDAGPPGAGREAAVRQ
jgi:hypothetical protein